MGFQLVKNDMNVNEHDRRVCIHCITFELLYICDLRDDYDGTIQRHWQHWTYKTHHEGKQEKKTNNNTNNKQLHTRKQKRGATQTPEGTQVLAMSYTAFLFDFLR
jgi:hypothetical protein